MILAALVAGCATASGFFAPSVTSVTWVYARSGSAVSPNPHWIRGLPTQESCIFEYLPGEGDSNLVIGKLGMQPRLSVHIRGRTPDDEKQARAFASECGLPPRAT